MRIFGIAVVVTATIAVAKKISNYMAIRKACRVVISAPAMQKLLEMELDKLSQSTDELSKSIDEAVQADRELGEAIQELSDEIENLGEELGLFGRIKRSFLRVIK